MRRAELHDNHSGAPGDQERKEGDAYKHSSISKDAKAAGAHDGHAHVPVNVSLVKVSPSDDRVTL